MAEEVTLLGDLKGDEFVGSAYELFDEFRTAYASEWSRLNKAEKYYQGKHWEEMNSETDDPEPMTPAFLSTVENMKADLADNYPQAIVQPEAPEDQMVAEIVGAVVRQNHDAANFRREYAKSNHDLLVGGWCVEEVGYDQSLNKGLGGAYIRNVDNHTILFDPQVIDIQLGRAVFKFSPVTKEWLNQKYPNLEFSQDTFTLEKDNELSTDSNKTILMLEVWYKQWIAEGDQDGHWAVHMAHMAGRQLLDDSRDEKPDGYFSMGDYPFCITTMYERKNSCLGYGLAEYFGNMQEFADRIDQIVLKNAAMSSRNKLLNTKSSGFDTDDLADWSKDVHNGENLNGITWFQTPPLPQYIIQYSDSIRSRMRDESGANDFSRGQTGSGVTAASSILALQEASSKVTRMVSMARFEAYKQAVRYEIEFEREFNTLPRQVNLTIDGQQMVSDFSSAIMERQTALGNNVPIEFMISIKVERENRFTTTAQNELILQMVQLGIILPQQAPELMIFEGKETLLNKMMAAQAQPQADPEMEQAQAEQAEIDQIVEGLSAPEESVRTDLV